MKGMNQRNPAAVSEAFLNGHASFGVNHTTFHKLYTPHAHAQTYIHTLTHTYVQVG